MNENLLLRQKVAEENKKKYEEESKARLQKIVTTKLKTAFIGALSEFEKSYGYLWGAKDSIPTDEQLDVKNALAELGFGEAYWLKVWESTRNDILTNGNNQVRAVQQEMQQYTINWNRYQMSLPVKN